MTGDIVHPATRIKRSVVMTIVALGLVARDLWRMRSWADEARAIELDVRARHGQEVNQISAEHHARIVELRQEIAKLRSNGLTPAQALNVVPGYATTAPEPPDADVVDGQADDVAGADA